jgi:integrase
MDGNPDLCPARAVRAWMDKVGEKRGPLFRSLKRNGMPRSSRLTAAQVGTIVKRAVGSAGLDPLTFGGHSHRAGYVTEARKASFP